MAEKATDEVSYDIFEWFPIRYCQNVFKYLSGKDVLQASAVNKEWYKFTAESQEAAKYRLFFSERSLTKEDEEILKNSTRRYQNIVLDGCLNETFLLELLAGRAVCWKSVRIILADFKEENTLTELLRIIEPTVEYLEIHALNVLKESAVVDVKLSFPQLKEIISFSSPDKFNIYKYFHNCENLSRFMWCPDGPSPYTMNNEILIFLYNNPNLEDLDVITADWDWLQQAHEFKFKLRKLFLSLGEPSTGMEPHLKAFLRIHAPTLESLGLGEMLDQELLELILTGMPRLTSLATEIYELEDAILEWEGEYPVNTTITKLSLGLEVKEKELSALEELLRALPSLKNFKCSTMNDDMMFALAVEAPGLESIEAKDFNVRQFPSGVFFPNFKEFKAQKLRQNLHEPINNGNFAIVVKKAMREYFGDDSEPSFDPLERFPIPYCREVFKYLSGKDMLEASAVSRKWYKFTGETEQASIYKLAFNAFNQKNLTTEAKKMLRGSNRCYQNIEFEGFSADGFSFFMKLLSLGAGLWKSVTLRHFYVDKESMIIKIFQIIEPSVEKLKVAKIRAKESSEDALPDWSFPNLKSLDCNQIPEELNFSKYFYGCRNLSRLKWHSIGSSPATDSDTPTARISRILYNNPDLKHLDLSSSDFMSFSRLNEIKFKLRELTIYADGLSRARTDLFAFLEAQAQTLESLDIEVLLTQELLELILTRMPRLTSFSMEIPEVEDAIFDWEGEYPVNTTITTLNVYDIVEKTRQRAPLEILIKAMSSLKNLKCKNLNDKLLNFLAREVPALESIDTSEFKVTRYPEGNIFPNFKSFKGKMLRKDYQAPTGDGNFAVVVRKEMERYFVKASTYDILKWFPISVCQNVFKYLSGKNVKQASAVNKKWYKFTAESQQVAKLRLRFSSFNARYLTAEAKEMLKHSKRQYQNVEFDGFPSEHSDFYLKLLADRAGSLKFVKLVSVYLDKNEMARLIGIIEPTVEELTMVKVSIKNYQENTEESLDVKWTFPRLKSLNCSKVADHHDFYQHLYKCTSLSKVTWTTWCSSTENLKIVPVLRNNADLKDLDVHAEDWTLLEHSSEFKFKLRKLVFTVNCKESSEAMLPLFYAFLETQAQSLESLETNVKLDQAFLELILNKMPRLSSLTVMFDQVAEAISSWHLPVNTTIATLALDGRIDDEHLAAYRIFIRALQSLRHIKFDRMTDEPFKILAQEVPALESIEVHKFVIFRLPSYEIFPNFKALEVKAFSDNLQEPIGDYKFAALVRRKMRWFYPPQYFTAGPSRGS